MSVHSEFDVVVVGFGGAGASAAIEAHDAGARVLIVEKAGEGGGNTLESGGTIRRLNDWRRAAMHYEALTRGTTPRDILDAFSQGVEDMLGWLTDRLGAELAPAQVLQGFPPMPLGSAYPSLPGADALEQRVRVRAGAPGEHGGKSLWDTLLANVQRRNIEVWYDSAAVRLLRDGTDGAVNGIVCARDGGEVSIGASGGVVLSCGGFAASHEMQKDYIGAVELAVFGPPGRNTGDGVKMAMSVGADLWHMNAIAGPFGYRFPEYEAAFTHIMPAAGYIYVDSRAHRFVNETGVDFHACAMAALSFDPVHAQYPRIPSCVIFDERTRKAGPISPNGAGWNRRFHRWSQDNSVELEKGWIKKADTLEELSEALGLPRDTLAATVKDYNCACASGRDDLFEREAEYLVEIAEPPFYGIELWPCLLNTQGGPRRDAQARIIDVRGDPIPGLFGAGELGSIWGMLYPGAGNVSEALVFGRIAGRHCAERARQAAAGTD